MTIGEGAAYLGMDSKAFRETMEILESVPDGTKFKDISQTVPGYNFHEMAEEKGQ